MRTRVLLKVAALAGILALTGCAAKVAQPNQYSGFLKDYSSLKETTSASGKPELRWIDPNFNPANYDNIVYHPVTYYPVPKPTTQVGEKALQDILNYTNKELKQAISERKPLATTAGKRSLIFRGAITGVDSSKEGLQFYEVIPVAMIVAAPRPPPAIVPWTPICTLRRRSLTPAPISRSSRSFVKGKAKPWRMRIHR